MFGTVGGFGRIRMAKFDREWFQSIELHWVRRKQDMREICVRIWVIVFNVNSYCCGMDGWMDGWMDERSRRKRWWASLEYCGIDADEDAHWQERGLRVPTMKAMSFRKKRDDIIAEKLKNLSYTTCTCTLASSVWYCTPVMRLSSPITLRIACILRSCAKSATCVHGLAFVH